MSDTGTDSDCTICVTNNGDIHALKSEDLMRSKKYFWLFFLYRQYINKKHIPLEIFQKS